MTEPDESGLWKYLELPQVFQQKAGEINTTCKQHLRICERLAGHVAKQRPKTAKDFEQAEYLKDFVVKSAELNEKTIQMIDYIKTSVQAICDDAVALKEGARLNAVIRDQGEKIETLIKERDEFMRKYYGIRKDRLAENPANS